MRESTDATSRYSTTSFRCLKTELNTERTLNILCLGVTFFVERNERWVSFGTVQQKTEVKE